MSSDYNENENNDDQMERAYYDIIEEAKQAVKEAEESGAWDGVQGRLTYTNKT